MIFHFQSGIFAWNCLGKILVFQCDREYERDQQSPGPKQPSLLWGK